MSAALNVEPSELKMLRETLCLAQSAMRVANDVSSHMRPSVADEVVVEEFQRQLRHLERIDGLIREIDRHRPLGPDGTHGDRHTATCGCEGPTAPPTGDERDALDQFMRYADGCWPTARDSILASGFRRRGPVTDGEVDAALGAYYSAGAFSVYRNAMRAALEAARAAE